MISIQSSLDELDRIHRMREGLLDCYLHAIRNCAAYAVELDAGATADYRQYLLAMAEDLSKGELPALLESRATFRSIVRAYRDKSTDYLRGMREELASTTRALEEILETISQADGEHETRLRSAVQNLRAIADTPEGRGVGAMLRNAAGVIEQSVEQMRRQHQLTISQFQMEIRMLHKRIDRLEAVASAEGLTRILNRAGMENRLREEVAGEYCLLLIDVRGLRRAETQFGPPVAEELAGAFTKRLGNCLPPKSVISRWGVEEMVVAVNAPKGETVALGKWITEHLSGAYACLHAGKTVRPALQLNVGVVDTAADETPEAILSRAGIFLSGT